MRMISYAQNREDVLLDRAFPGDGGFYVDVGASDPVVHSVTKWFYDRGWSGVNVEPHKGTFALLEADRPRDVNLNVAVSDKPGTAILYEIPDTIGLDTLDLTSADKVRAEGRPVVETETTCITLTQVFDRHVGDRTVTFLKVDAEGHERAVLAGMDFTRWRPRVLVVEATEPCSPVPCHDKWENLILPYRYQFAFFDGLNRYYVRDEDADLIPVLAVPANVFDDFVPHTHLVEVKDWEGRVLAKSREADGLRFELSGVRAEFEEAVGQLSATQAGLEAARTEIETVRSVSVGRRALATALAFLGETRTHLEKSRETVLATPRWKAARVVASGAYRNGSGGPTSAPPGDAADEHTDSAVALCEPQPESPTTSEPAPEDPAVPDLEGRTPAPETPATNLRRAELYPGFEITSENVVADIGCGSAGVCVFAGNLGADVIALDIEPAYLEHAAKVMRDVPARSFRTVLTRGDELPLEAAAADTVLAFEVLEHTDDPAQFLGELYRIARPGGRLLLSVPDPASESVMRIVAPPSYFQKPEHQHVFEHDRLDGLIRRAGFEIVSRSYTGFYHAMWWFLRMGSGTSHCPGGPNPPGVLTEWEGVWNALLKMPRAAEVVATLDRILPKSQVVQARKPI